MEPCKQQAIALNSAWRASPISGRGAARVAMTSWGVHVVLHRGLGPRTRGFSIRASVASGVS